MGEKTESIKIQSSPLQLLTILINGPFAVLAIVGLGLWWASKMTADQVDTVNHLIAALNNPVGYFLGVVMLFCFAYALIFYPIGKFLSELVRQYTSAQVGHNTDAAAHHAASKEMYNRLGEIEGAIREMTKYLEEHIAPSLKKILHFYEGKIT